jgi:hypothetical protein
MPIIPRFLEVSMDYGAMMFSIDYSIRPDDLARLLEDRGFESMWCRNTPIFPPTAAALGPGAAICPKTIGIPTTPSSR